MDPQHIQLAKMCRVLTGPASESSFTSVFVGMSGSDYAMYKSTDAAQNEVGAYSATAFDVSIAAGRVSFLFNFTGAAVSVDTACSSALVAFHLAKLETGCERSFVAATHIMLVK